MKLTQEIRDFTAEQDTGNFLAGTENPPGARTGTMVGMAEMSEKFHERGGETYLPAAD